MADQLNYLGPHAQATQIIKKSELVYGMVVSSDIVMQNFYHLQQNKGERFWHIFIEWKGL